MAFAFSVLVHACLPSETGVPAYFIKKKYISVFTCVCVYIHLCVCVWGGVLHEHMCSAHEGQKRVSDHMELELQMVISFLVLFLETELQSSGKAVHVLKQSHLSCPANF